MNFDCTPQTHEFINRSPVASVQRECVHMFVYQEFSLDEWFFCCAIGWNFDSFMVKIARLDIEKCIDKMKFSMSTKA